MRRFAVTLLGAVLLSHSAWAVAPGTATTLTVGAAGKATTLTAHVVDGSGAAVEEGSVSFAAGAASLGSAPLGKGGEAAITVTSLPAAGQGDADGTTVPVVAVYHPLAAGAWTSSASGITAVHAAADGVPDFSIAGTPTSLTVAQGSYGNSLITVTPLNGYNAQVTLSCTGLPAQVTCTFTPVINSTANGSFTSTLQVQTQGGAGSQLFGPAGRGGSNGLAWAWVLPVGALGLAGARRRRRGGLWSAGGATVLVVAGLGLGLLSVSGCSNRYGYNHHPPAEPVGTAVGTYTLTVEASGNTGSAVTVHDLAVTLEVQ